MSEEKFNFNLINDKIIYSLSFILILLGLKDFFDSWSQKLSISLFNISLTIKDIISIMILILFVSIYFYGINYLILNPLNKLKKFINDFASAIWFIFFIFPIFIIVSLFLREIFSNPELLTTIISLLFGLLGIWISYLSQKQLRNADLLILDKHIELLKSKIPEKDKTAEFLRYYLILDYLIKRALVQKIKLPLNLNKSTNLTEATKILLNHKQIKIDTANNLNDLLNLRNKVVHGDYNPSEQDIQQIKNLIKNLDLDLKESKDEHYKNTPKT